MKGLKDRFFRFIPDNDVILLHRQAERSSSLGGKKSYWNENPETL